MAKGSGAGLAGLAIALTLTACEVPRENTIVDNVENPSVTAISYTGSQRAVYFFPGETEGRYCAEPSPDVALDSIQKIAAQLDVAVPQGPTVGGSLNTELAAKVVQLAGRSQLVVLAREMLYRACELSINNRSPEAVAKSYELYAQVVELVKFLAEAERASAAAELVRASPGSVNTGELLDQIFPDQ